MMAEFINYQQGDIIIRVNQWTSVQMSEYINNLNSLKIKTALQVCDWVDNVHVQAVTETRTLILIGSVIAEKYVTICSAAGIF